MGRFPSGSTSHSHSITLSKVHFLFVHSLHAQGAKEQVIAPSAFPLIDYPLFRHHHSSFYFSPALRSAASCLSITTGSVYGARYFMTSKEKLGSPVSFAIAAS